MHFLRFPLLRRPLMPRGVASHGLSILALAALFAGACGGGAPAGPGGGNAKGGPGGAPQAMPVPITTVTDTDLRDASEYVATLKSRHTTTVQPQVEGVLTHIFVKSGDRVAAGAPLMQIDPEKQRATVLSQQASRQLKAAALNYARQQKERMQALYQGGAASKQQLDEAQSGLDQAKADYDALGAQVREQEVQLGYFKVVAPAAGVIGDIPVRTGDRVTTATLLTTIDKNDALEAYISVPIERARDLRLGLPVEILGDRGEALASSAISFIAPQVDDQTQQVLVKAPVPNGQNGLRSDQFVRARVVWSTHRGPVVPVLAVTRVNGQYFIFGADAGGPNGALVAKQKPVKLGDMVGDNYVVQSGLAAGDKIVASGVQKLFDGMPITPMPSQPPGPGGPGGGGAPGGAPGAGSGSATGAGSGSAPQAPGA